MIKYKYLVYPPNYKPSDGSILFGAGTEPGQYSQHNSLKTATKRAIKLGAGAIIHRNRYKYRKGSSRWYSFDTDKTWIITQRSVS